MRPLPLTREAWQLAIRVGHVAYLSFLILCALAGHSTTAHSETTYFIHPLKNRVLDAQSIRLVAGHSRLVLLQAEFQPASKNGKPLRQLIQSLHSARRGMHVLTYSWLSRLDRRAGANSWAEMLEGLERRPDFFVRGLDGVPLRNYPDPSNKEFRAWLARRVSEFLSTVGADGVVFDLAYRTPTEIPALDRMCKEVPNFCPDYQHGMDALFHSVSDSIGQRDLFFNGLWNFHVDMLADQARLLDYADGAAIEYFGLNPLQQQTGTSYRHSFSRDILPFLNIARAFPSKTILFFGRGPWHYVDYRTDFLWQRYLYCSYLLTAQARSSFKYLATFQVPTTAGRAGGLATYSDWALNLGEPLGEYRLTNGIYSREFSKAWVYVAPDDGPPASVTFSGPLYTPEGNPLSGTQKLEPGTGLLLLKDKPQPKPVEVDWPAGTELSSWLNGHLEKDSADSGFVVIPRDDAPPRDLRLDFTRSLAPYQELALRFRLQDAKARILAVAEVDDINHRIDHAIVEVSDRRETKRALPILGYRLRAGDVKGVWPLIPTAPVARGIWSSVTLGPEIFEGTKFRFRRWVFLRVEGALQFSGAQLRRPRSLD